MSTGAEILAAMQNYLYRAVESGGTAVIDTSSSGLALEHQLCRIDVPMWMAGGWVVTVGPPPSKGSAPDQVAGQWPVDQMENYALIRFGHGKAVHVVEVDISRGLRIGLFASSIDVRIVQPGIVLPAAPHGMPYRQVGSIVRGELGAGNHCRRTIPIGSVASAATSCNIPIPPFARNMVLQGVFLQSQVFLVRFRDRAGLNVRSENWIANTDQEYKLGQPMPIPATATSLSVYNGGGFGVSELVAIFELHL